MEKRKKERSKLYLLSCSELVHCLQIPKILKHRIFVSIQRSKQDSLSMKMEYYNIHVCERILEKGPYGEKIATVFYDI